MMEEETIRTFYKKWKARLLKWSSLVCAVVFYMYRKTFDYFKYFFFYFRHTYRSGTLLQILQQLNLYSRIGIVYRGIHQLWLPLVSVIFFDILMLVTNWAFVICCFLFDNFAEGGDCNCKYGIPFTAVQAT